MLRVTRLLMAERYERDSAVHARELEEQGVEPVLTGSREGLCDLDGSVAVVTLNRPQRHNALTPDVLQTLAELIPNLECDQRVKVILLTGAGDSFCAGGDISAMESSATGGSASFGPVMDASIQRTRYENISRRLWTMPKPTIAALHGAVAGGGSLPASRRGCASG